MTEHYLFRRIMKDWDNKRVDWALIIRRERYHWISRWYPRKTASSGNLTINEIMGINLSSYSLGGQQLSHYDNYACALHSAKALYTAGMIRDACLFAHLAAEHLMKQIFLKTSLSFHLKYSEDLSTKHREPHRSHEVGAIITEITRISIEMRGLQELQNLKLAVDEFNSKIGEWSTARYNSPLVNHTELTSIGQKLILEMTTLETTLNQRGYVR